MGSLGHLGPDLDKNYGYDGVLYITGLLEYKYGTKKEPDKRIERLDRVRKIIARVHGMGRASKNRPSVILEMAKDTHKAIGDELKRLQGDEEQE